MTGIWVDEDNPNYVSDDSGVLFNKDMTLLVRAHKEIAGDYTIPQTVTTIDGWAFDGCTNLADVTLGNNVTSISYALFHGCSNLVCITIPDSVTYIDEYAFYNCRNLEEIHYTGTKEQWYAIVKEYSWHNGAYNFTVYCIDGTIEA